MLVEMVQHEKLVLCEMIVGVRLNHTVSESKSWDLKSIQLVYRSRLVHIISIEQKWVYTSSITLAEFEISKVSAKILIMNGF